MTDDRKLKKAIRARQIKTGESYMEARRHVLGDAERDGTTSDEPPGTAASAPDRAVRARPASASPRPGRGPISIEDLNEDIIHTPEGQELLVPVADPQGGPYTSFLRVPEGEVEARCRDGYRRITAYEHDEMLGEIEDYASDWKHID